MLTTNSMNKAHPVLRGMGTLSEGCGDTRSMKLICICEDADEGGNRRQDCHVQKYPQENVRTFRHLKQTPAVRE